jgi:hypothetical protein
MTDLRDKTDRLAKRDEAATGKIDEEVRDAAKSAVEQTREVAQQTFDRIKAAREARRREAVKKDG